MIADAVAGVVGKLIDRFIPDPAQKAAAEMELLRMAQAGEFKQIETELQLAQMQADVNKVEAGSADPFTSRARPFIIWMCGLSLGYAAIVDPFSRFIAAVFMDYPGPFPAVDTTITLQVLLGLLGLSGLRSYDKKNGVAS